LKEVIKNREIFFLVLVGIIGLSLNIPKDFGTYAATGGWVIPVVGGGAAILSGFIILALNLKYEQKAIYEYLQNIVGKYLSALIMLIYFFRFIFLGSLVTRALLQVVKETILIKTPYWPLAFIFLLSASYAASRGLQSFSYICEFYYLFLMLLSIIIFATMFSSGELINVRPFFVKEDTLIYLKESLRNFRIFLGLDVLLLIPLSKQHNKNINFTLILGIIFICIFYIVGFEATVAVAGIEDTVLYDDIFLLSVRRVEIYGVEFLRRLDGVAITNFIISILMMVALDMYCAGAILNHYFKKMNFKKINLGFSCLIVAFICFLICIYISDAFVLTKLLTFSYMLLTVTCLVIPILLFIMIVVKNYVKKTL
jgi:spore germination protein